MIAISMAHNLINYEAGEETGDEKDPPPSLGYLRSIKPFLRSNSAFYFLVTSYIHKNEYMKKKSPSTLA